MKDNQEKNKEHYDKLYDNYDIKNILYWINHLDEFLDSAIATETSWFALYHGDFRHKLKGKKVLEMGCGNCINAAIMAALGAEVYANDIAPASGGIVKKLNENFEFETPIVFVEGDFLQNELPTKSFDYVVGKAFLHHLTLPVEREFLKETARLLKTGGEARFFEPAVNNKILDEVRWHIPVSGRPSKFNRKSFREWKKNDPHPERTLSSQHFITAGQEFFKKTEILPVGTLERFSRLFPWGKNRNNYKRWSLKNEALLPAFLNLSFARGQLIIYQNKREV